MPLSSEPLTKPGLTEIAAGARLEWLDLGVDEGHAISPVILAKDDAPRKQAFRETDVSGQPASRGDWPSVVV